MASPVIVEPTLCDTDHALVYEESSVPDVPTIVPYSPEHARSNGTTRIAVPSSVGSAMVDTPMMTALPSVAIPHSDPSSPSSATKHPLPTCLPSFIALLDTLDRMVPLSLPQLNRLRPSSYTQWPESSTPTSTAHSGTNDELARLSVGRFGRVYYRSGLFLHRRIRWSSLEGRSASSTVPHAQ